MLFIRSTKSEAFVHPLFYLRFIVPFLCFFVDREMLGAGFQLTRGRHGDDPFYSSAKARRANQRIDQLRRAQSDVSNGRSANPKENLVNRECENESASQKLVPSLASEPSASSSSNLERFLESVTPSVPAQYLSKVCLNMSTVFMYFLKAFL